MHDSDLAVLNLLRESEPLTISGLVDALGVTATAVRQKMDRLVAAGFVRRELQSPAEGQSSGRGRPSFDYELTEVGRRQLGHNLGDLAVALWEEVRRIPDPEIRSSVLSGVMKQLELTYGDRIAGRTLEQRLSSLAELFAQRQIAVDIDHSGSLPVIQVHGCPYPDLAQNDRTICEWETELFSKLVGHPIRLGRCQDHGCCTFQATASPNDTAATA